MPLRARESHEMLWLCTHSATSEKFAIKELAILADLSSGINYGELKLHPCRDPL